MSKAQLGEGQAKEGPIWASASLWLSPADMASIMSFNISVYISLMSVCFIRPNPNPISSLVA